MKYVGIDGSLTATGVVSIDSDGKIDYREIKTKKSDQHNILRCQYIASAIEDFIGEGDVCVAVEDYFGRIESWSIDKALRIGYVGQINVIAP